MFLLFARLAVSLVRVKLVPWQPAFYWEPSFPHTIVVFPRPLDSSIVVDIVSSSDSVVQSLSRIESVIAINFGSDTGLKLRFQCPSKAPRTDAVEFAAFEPAAIPDHYVVSTAARENFAVSSPGLCARPDFGIAPPLSYGFFYLNEAASRIKNKQFNIRHNDRVRYAVYDVPKPVLTELPVHEQVNIETQSFSEWIVRTNVEMGNRTFVLLARPIGETEPSLPEFRAVFTSRSGLTVIRGGRGANRRFLSDDPCEFEPVRRIPEKVPVEQPEPEPLPEATKRLKRHRKEHAQRTEEPADGLRFRDQVIIALFIATVIFVIGIIVRIVRRSRQPRPRDMDGLLVGDGDTRTGIIPGLDTREAPALADPPDA